MKEFLELHFGDLVSLFLVAAGVALVVWARDAVSRDWGGRLTAAALLGLKLTYPKRDSQ